MLFRSLLLQPSILPSSRVFFNESVLHIRWPKYWRFSFSISPSNEYSGLISFRMDWFDLLAVQGTLKSLLQHHSSEASILRRSALFVIPWTAACPGSLSITNSQSLLKLMPIELVMSTNHLILFRPLLLPSVFPSIRVFYNESVCIRWPKY